MSLKISKDFYKLFTEIRIEFFPNENHGYTENPKYHETTRIIELFNNGCLTYDKFISRLSITCQANQEVIHNRVSKFIFDFDGYVFNPKL